MSDARPYSVDAARSAADRNELNTWVAEFLGSPGSDNALLGEKLTEPPRYWIGPVRLRLSSLHRLAGPPDEPVLVAVDEDDWRDDVEEMAELVDGGWQPAPVIVTHRRGQLVLEDGNHRVEALRRAGREEAWAVVGFENPADRERFEAPSGA